MEPKRDEQPLSDSLDEMWEARGVDDVTKEKIRRDMLLTQPRNVYREALH